MTGYKLCPECDQPILRAGQIRKSADEYRHARGCPLDDWKEETMPIPETKTVYLFVAESGENIKLEEIPYAFDRVWQLKYRLSISDKKNGTCSVDLCQADVAGIVRDLENFLTGAGTR